MKAILESLKEIRADTSSLGNRLTALETGDQERKRDIAARTDETEGSGGENGGNGPVIVQAHGKEKALTLTFGEDESATALRLFIEHYRLAKNQNVRKKIEGWDLADFRANELRFQLRGRTASWILQESAMGSVWVKNDEAIIRHLEERYLGTQCVELNIIAFEDLRQTDGETLASYMTRCQEKGYQAFADFDRDGVQQRIVWKFLSGIKDADVRAQVIKEKWMESATKAKSFSEVLKIAETAKLSKVATAATGSGRGNPGDVGKVASMSRVDERRRSYKKQRVESGEDHNRHGRTQHHSNESTGSGTSDGTSSTKNFQCHYCNETSHYGGWKMCEKRKKENPSWKPNFQ